MWADIFLWNNGMATGWCVWKVLHLKHPPLSAMPVGPHNFAEKQVSHGDLVVVSNEPNLFQDLTLKIGKDALPKLAFSRLKPEILCSYESLIYIL